MGKRGVQLCKMQLQKRRPNAGTSGYAALNETQETQLA